MRPPLRPKGDFEKVKIGEMITGIIEEVQYDQEHVFKGFSGGSDTKQPAIRFKFKLDEYVFPHFSRWMKFSTYAKANLYTKYLSKLVEGAMPDIDMDMDVLLGMRIKTVWSENGDFQNIDAIYPNGPKVKPGDPIVHDDIIDEPPIEDAPPF